MRYEDERYVRLYTRDTATWIAIGWEGRHVLVMLLRKVDRAGVIDLLEGEEVESIAQLIMSPVEVVAAGLNKLIERKVVKIEAGQLFWPRFLEAQETPTSDKLRKQKSRELAALGPGAVTNGHALSRMVTPNLAVPSRAEPNLTEPNRTGAARTKKSKPPADAPPELPAAGDPPQPKELTPIQWHVRDYEEQRSDVLTDELGLPFTPDDEINWPRVAVALGPLLERLKALGRGKLTGWQRLLVLWFAEPWAAGMTPPFPINAMLSPRVLDGDPDKPNLPGLIQRITA